MPNAPKRTYLTHHAENFPEKPFSFALYGRLMHLEAVKDNEPLITVTTPIYLVTSWESCWQCGESEAVIALATTSVIDDDDDDYDQEGDDEPYLLMNVREMPEEVVRTVQERHPRFQKCASKTAGFTYYANHCECGANFGDFFLHSKPGHAFFPMSDEAAARITVLELPFKGKLKFFAEWSQGTASEILEKGKRVKL